MRRLDGTHDVQTALDALFSMEGGLVFNVGANIGQNANLLAKRFGHVIAYEPCFPSFQILEAEAKPNVKAMHCALSDHVGSVELYQMSRSFDTGQLTSGEGLHWGEVLGTETVPCSTLDAESILWGAPDLITVDTEGHEVEVIQGGAQLIGEYHPDLYVEIHAEGNAEAIEKLCPGYRWADFRWPFARPDSMIWHHHWLLGIWENEG